MFVAVEGLRPHPDPFGALFGLVRHLEPLSGQPEQPIHQRRLTDSVLAYERYEPDREVALCDEIKRFGVDFNLFGLVVELDQLDGVPVFGVVVVVASLHGF